MFSKDWALEFWDSLKLPDLLVLELCSLHVRTSVDVLGSLEFQEEGVVIIRQNTP